MTKSFYTRWVLGHRFRRPSIMELQIKKGETLGLVGESGCGKSTVARLITRPPEPSFGKVFFKGVDLFSLPQAEMLAK